jgi:hypothetical protein
MLTSGQAWSPTTRMKARKTKKRMGKNKREDAREV